ncbi:hypothetical protein MNBD_NITROSPINAE04-1195 [hydrothermal vent metagenome]|uniref:Uncharacterized protein n=1 Tax=hydrothermal vent metagenome TaxID=652676 RepID=A0A3B1CB72_9ZZZZ
MIIYLKADYTVIGKLSYSEKPIITFSVPNDSKFPVMVILNSENNTVEASTQFEVSEELHKEIEAYFTNND